MLTTAEEERGRSDHLAAAQDQAGSAEQSRIDLLGRRIKADRGELEDTVLSGQLKVINRVAEVIDQGAVWREDAFGPAARAGGVDEIGEVMRSRPGPRIVLTLLREDCALFVQAEKSEALLIEALCQSPISDQDLRRGVPARIPISRLDNQDRAGDKRRLP